MQVNPFIRPLPRATPKASNPPPVQASVSDSQKIIRGMHGSERAESIKAIASDIQARTARIEHLRVMSQKMQQDIKNLPQKGSSRIAQLARQLDKDF
ncbi:MAG: hypothetical protein P1P90_06755 [Patescibacteria group bacterium]|nr:hypothetical protein [Patescibacteria group bacterium]